MQRPNSMFLKGHGNEADFLGFLQKLVSHRSLTLTSSCSDFGFEFAEIFVIENDSPTQRLGDPGESGSWRLSDSRSLEVANTPIWRVGETMTPLLAESESRLLNVKRKLGESPWLVRE